MKGFSKRSILGLLGAVLMAGAIGAALVAWSVTRSARRAEPEPEPVIPPEQRHDYLDVTVVKGLRYRHPGRGWDVRVGAVEIRRKSLGFIRIGAFNEALITDMHITLTPEFSVSEVIALLRSLTDASSARANDQSDNHAQPPTAARHAQDSGLPGCLPSSVEKANGTPSGRGPRQVGFFLEQLGVTSPHAGTRVSSVRVRNLSLRFAPGNGEPEIIYLSASSANIRGGELRLGGRISFGTPADQQIRCREARLSLGEPPMVSLRKAVVYSGGVTQTVDRLSFPLSALLNDEDLLSYAD